MNITHLRNLADEMESHLWSDLLELWFPRAIDPAGGFFQEYGRDWSQGANKTKFIVHQCRLIWVAATVAEAYPEKRGEFATYAEHGFRFVADRMRSPNAMFHWRCDVHGIPPTETDAEQHGYGLAFALYALAAYARCCDSVEALELAKTTFAWIQDHLYDKVNKGYFEKTDAYGTVIPGHGIKTQNTLMHLFEAFAELARVWPDATVIAATNELADVLEHNLYEPEGCLHANVTVDLKPIGDQIQFGHDIETAHLLIDAAAIPGVVGEERAFRLARSLSSHTLTFGWDKVHGGFYNVGNVQGKVLGTTKHWWVHVEALYAVALLHRKDGGMTDWIDRIWAYIRDVNIDPVHKGWFGSCAEDGTPLQGGSKGHEWKAAYHEMRGLHGTVRVLRSLE